MASKIMRAVTGVVLVMAGISIGTYAILGKGTGTRASPSSGLADAASGPPPADPAKIISIAEVPLWMPVGLHAPSSETPVGLTRDIQLQLKRVGCYQGEIDGVWSASVSRSMKAFTDHVNAALPVDQPDIVLLALLQNHRTRVCGAPCPSAADDGRCQPTGLVIRPPKQKVAADVIVAKHAIVGSPGSAAKVMRKAPARRAVRVAAVKAWRSHRAPRREYTGYPTWAARAFSVIH